jgi:putative ABC transport system permease protein
MVSTLNRKLWRDIRRHRAQFIAVVVTVFLGVTMFVASYDSYLNLDASYQATFTEYRFANVTYVGGDVEALAGSVAVVEGVESVAVRTVADHPLQIGGVKMLGRVVGVPADQQADVNQLKVLEGSYLGVGDSVLVEEHMANHFDLRPGESVDVLAGDNWISAEVAGIVSSPEYIWPSRNRQGLITTPDNFGVIFATEETARMLTEIGPNELAVYFDGGVDDGGLLEQLAPIAAAAGATADYTRAEQPSNAALSEDIQGFEEMAGFFPLLFLTAAGLASYVMISRLVHAQRPHIGAMLANGMTKRKILRHYLGYGVVPGLVAAIPGAIAGALLARVITTFYTGLLSVPVTLIEFYPVNAVGGILFGVGAAFLAALARRARRIAYSSSRSYARRDSHGRRANQPARTNHPSASAAADPLAHATAWYRTQSTPYDLHDCRGSAVVDAGARVVGDDRYGQPSDEHSVHRHPARGRDGLFHRSGRACRG